MMTTNYDKMHLDAFDVLTANASDELRQELWENQEYKNKSLAELQMMIQLLPKQGQVQGNPYGGDTHRGMVGNMFGAQGAPPMGQIAANEGQKVLDIETIDFAAAAKERRAM